jgi:hypothetical protein
MCVLSDFGISRIVESNNILFLQNFEFNALIGLSAPYAGPESWMFRRRLIKYLDKNATFAGDVYSWSVVMFETINRSRPWRP